jgi:hypothetical protein
MLKLAVHYARYAASMLASLGFCLNLSMQGVVDRTTGLFTPLCTSGFRS